MAFRYEGKDIATALGQAVLNKEASGEAPVTFGYDNSSPRRFAGQSIAQNLGMDGEFGFMANNKQDREGQRRIGQFAQQWASGPFGPDGGIDGGIG